MTETHFDKRRLRKEAAVRAIDLIAYIVILLSGVAAILFPPKSTVQLVDGPLILAWGILLIVSGAVGFLGRFTRYWAIEAPATILGAIGGLFYFVVLVYSTIDGSISGAVASTFVACMSLLLWRRYVELQLFTEDPQDPNGPQVRTIRDRIRALFSRKTKDAISSGKN